MSIKKIAKKIIFKYKLKSLHELYIKYESYVAYFKLKEESVYELNLEGNKVLFDITDSYTKRLFYPFIKSDSIYEHFLSHHINSKMKEDSCFLDIGGYIGYFSCIAGNKGKKGEVHCFEVDPNSIEYINKNIAINGLTNVKLNNVAVSDAIGQITIRNTIVPSSRTNILDDVSNGVTVNTVTIDQYIKENNLQPNLIKVDVEGAEVKVFRGMKETLKRSNLSLVIEIHEKAINGFGFKSSEIIDALISNNFNVYEIKEFRNDQFKKQKIERNHKFDNNCLIVAEREA